MLRPVPVTDEFEVISPGHPLHLSAFAVAVRGFAVFHLPLSKSAHGGVRPTSLLPTTCEQPPPLSPFFARPVVYVPPEAERPVSPRAAVLRASGSVPSVKLQRFLSPSFFPFQVNRTVPTTSLASILGFQGFSPFTSHVVASTLTLPYIRLRHCAPSVSSPYQPAKRVFCAPTMAVSGHLHLTAGPRSLSPLCPAPTL